MPCDLHTHSTHSDGTLTPSALIALAKEAGLTAVALTDHNSISGLPDFMAEAHRQGVTPVAGTELSTLHGGKELHLLGLFIPPEHFGAVTSLTQDYLIRKDQSNRDLTNRLAAHGYPIDYDEIQQKNPNGNINRALIAKELMAKGCVPSVAAAFNTLLGEGMGYYIPPERPGFFDTIRFLRSIHALPVWAHPLQYADESFVRSVLPAAVKAGLVGLEVMHSSYDEATVSRAQAIADEFGLLYSGGSDYHGVVKPHVSLGIGSQNGTEPNIPHKYYETLRDVAKKL